jgi:hypothetical protein
MNLEANQSDIEKYIMNQIELDEDRMEMSAEVTKKIVENIITTSDGMLVNGVAFEL